MNAKQRFENTFGRPFPKGSHQETFIPAETPEQQRQRRHQSQFGTPATVAQEPKKPATKSTPKNKGKK